MSVSAPSRLARLLNLVPYLQTRPGIRVAEAADELGVTEAQLRDDLTLLWMCGLPGYGPGDLIDMSLDEETVTITFGAELNRPLRLNSDEALALIVALRLLAETPGLRDVDAVRRALAKLESACGDAADAAARVEVSLRAADGWVPQIRNALRRQKALRITYYTAGRDASSERVVDPMRLLVVDDFTYLEAWCRRAEGMRRFRLDRIDALAELEEDAAPPPQARPSDVRAGLFQPSDDQPLVTVRIGRDSRWITEYYRCEDVRAEHDGRWLVSLRAANMDWAARFVLGLGADAQVVAPVELAERVAGDVRAALAAYDGADG